MPLWNEIYRASYLAWYEKQILVAIFVHTHNSRIMLSQIVKELCS